MHRYGVQEERMGIYTAVLSIGSRRTSTGDRDPNRFQQADLYVPVGRSIYVPADR